MAHQADRRVRLLNGLRLPDRYEVRRRLGSGGMAAVWCAHDHALGRNVAIKLLSRSFAHDQGAVRRFNREARAAARLSGHRHVITIYDVGEAVDDEEELIRPFIVMEYLAGGTVADALRVRAVSRAQAVRWLHEAAAALDFAHSRGVIHRDVKPVNFLLDCERVLHVADFGIAQLGTEDTVSHTGQMLGTAAYIAPEQALGKPATDASDRYALAVAAFELLAGERPFAAETPASQARQHLEDDPPRASQRNPSLPGALDAVLARGLAKRPEDRWPTAGQLADAIDGALHARAPVATINPNTATIGPWRTRQPQSRRPVSRRAAVAALAAGVLGVGIAAAVSGDFWHGKARVSAAVTHHAGPAHGRQGKRHTHAGASSRQHHHTHRTPATTATAAATTSVTTTSSTVEASPAAATTPLPTADTLEAKGHALMEAGSYSAAVPVLRQAVTAASPASLTYAYALFDLGRSLRLSGDPKAAVPLLWRRLQIPNQTDVVRAELQLALRALGQRASRG